MSAEWRKESDNVTEGHTCLAEVTRKCPACEERALEAVRSRLPRVAMPEGLPDYQDLFGLLSQPLADGRKWTVQGLGMLRTYWGSNDAVRINIWDSLLAYAGASSVHSHPWHFKSWIMSGGVINKLLERAPYGEEYEEARIVCGTSNIEPIGSLMLHHTRSDVYLQGQQYSMDASQIHDFVAIDGTVTVNLRERVTGDMASVFYRRVWVSAEPRPATAEEVLRTVARALRLAPFSA